MDILSVLEGTVVEENNWFVLVKRRREHLNDNRTTDELSDPKSMLRLGYKCTKS